MGILSLAEEARKMRIGKMTLMQKAMQMTMNNQVKICGRNMNSLVTTYFLYVSTWSFLTLKLAGHYPHNQHAGLCA